MNRIENLFQNKKNILNIYLTAGYPKLNDSVEVVRELERSGVDLVEIGMPFSDPLADGPTIHAAATEALEAGATLSTALEGGRAGGDKVPVVFLAYANMVLAQGGAAKFAEVARALDRGEAACRQLAARARGHIEAARPRFPASREEGHRLAAAFQAPASSGTTPTLTRR